MAAEHDKASPRPFNLSKKFVGETHLRGVVEKDSLLVTDKDSLVATDEDSQVATDEDSLGATDEAVEDSLSDTRDNWLEEHNTRRKFYHESFLVSYVPLEWSVGLMEEATEWAESLAKDCRNKSPNDIDYGVNSQGITGSDEKRTAKMSLDIWEKKLDMGYPANNAMTQALWRPTKYVGCGSASRPASTLGEKKERACAYSVCFYAKPGNCGMGQFRGGEGDKKWETPTYDNDSGCTPECPPEGCE